jgi:hypothetical protein
MSEEVRAVPPGEDPAVTVIVEATPEVTDFRPATSACFTEPSFHAERTVDW